MVSKKCGWLVLLTLALVLSPDMTQAKTVDLSAHFTSESYWSNHAIYVARITEVRRPASKNAPQGWTTSFELIESISGTASGKSGSIQSRTQDEMCPSNDQPEAFPKGLGPGAKILVSEDTRYKQVTVVRVLKFPDDQPLLMALQRIARVRQTPNLPDLLTGATSESDLLSEYCLDHLLALPDQTLSNDDLRKLQSVADDPKHSGEQRIAAEDNALKFSGAPRADRDTAEYAWLLDIVQTERQGGTPSTNSQNYLEHVEPFLIKLFRFQQRQPETADYMLDLLADKKAPANLRNAAGSVLSRFDQSVFNFQHPDERFDRMFNTYLALLKEESPDLRIMGTSLLFDRALRLISYQSPQERVDAYTKTAVQALQNALANEKDVRVRTYFSSRLEIQKSQALHPEIIKQMRDEYAH